MTVTIRPYTPKDAGTTIAIFLRAIKEVASRDYTPEQIEVWAQVENPDAWAAARSNRPTWIAEVDGRPAGFADLRADGCLDMMFVLPEFQGAGVASRLLERVEAEAHTKGLEHIHTEASKTARPFFERRGFRVVKAQRVEKRDQMLENFRMEKALGSGDSSSIKVP